MPCSWAELIWAAITVGKQNWTDVWRFGDYSLLEVTFRATMTYASLMEESRTRRIKQTTVFANMDPSEKTSISYFHGLMSTKLLAKRLLGVRWLWHFDVYKRGISHTLQGNYKPDFIGQDTKGNWIVLEDKGRSNGFDRDSITKGKRQTRGLRRIEGHYPSLRAVIQSYFSNGYFKNRIVDPQGFEPNAIDVEIDFSVFIQKYYGFVLELLRFHSDSLETMKFGGSKFVTLQLETIGISIGMNAKLYQLLSDHPDPDIDQINAITTMQVIAESDHPSPNNVFVGRDGIVIQTNNLWSEEAMQMEPDSRRNG